MRKFILLAVFMIGYLPPMFSQTINQIQSDTDSVKFGFNNSAKRLKHDDSIDFRQFLYNPPIHKYQLDPKSADKDLHFGQLENVDIEIPSSYDNMPVIRPQGSYPLSIYKPDSTLNYTLMIKKIAKKPGLQLAPK
jgi:hypothetical protein